MIYICLSKVRNECPLHTVAVNNQVYDQIKSMSKTKHNFVRSMLTTVCHNLFALAPIDKIIMDRKNCTLAMAGLNSSHRSNNKKKY